jgi:hypothetical protein
MAGDIAKASCNEGFAETHFGLSCAGLCLERFLMPRGLLFLSLSAALAFSTAASAEPTGAGKQADATAEAPGGKAVTHGNPNRKVCRTVEATGSRLNRAKICKTAREWSEQQVEHKENLDRMQRPRTPDVG